jgi:hypothetical protein
VGVVDPHVSIRIFGESQCCQATEISPVLPDTGPPSTAGFVFLDGLFSTAGAVPANLPVGRDLTIRRKIETAGIIVLLAAQKSIGKSPLFRSAAPHCGASKDGLGVEDSNGLVPFTRNESRELIGGPTGD